MRCVRERERERAVKERENSVVATFFIVLPVVLSMDRKTVNEKLQSNCCHHTHSDIETYQEKDILYYIC